MQLALSENGYTVFSEWHAGANVIISFAGSVIGMSFTKGVIFFKTVLYTAHFISLVTAESQDNLMAVRKLRIISKNTVQ